jgi:hypothetical protein
MIKSFFKLNLKFFNKVMDAKLVNQICVECKGKIDVDGKPVEEKVVLRLK